ncbi:hypothetical protein ACE1MK_07770 [Tenacibaculum maritimum]|uniref:hypothetical protein n=1 Tax=Tenacibaculum maritimum TaxID=107401 RepID=UPI0012E3FC4A|nr:hypothetical protein [Tenacibaculum maritimum]CAA0205881.1 conserved hypothetical protein [Tenacibaculum maritimum]
MKAKKINLEFLYYQRKLVLDGVDSQEIEYKKIARIFKNRMKVCELEEAIQLIILGYKEQYAQHKFYSTCFYEVKTPIIDTEYPENLRKHDFYMPKEEMSRDDIEHLILRIFEEDYTKTNTDYLKELELVFTDPQSLPLPIEEALEGKDFSKRESSDTIIYTVENSPIKEIEITSKKFVLRTNRDKWKAYY